jgi:DNA mismatch endonuclease Vsr
MDKLTKEHISKNMQAVKSKRSKIETLLAKELWKKGHSYRKNNMTVFGQPDLIFKIIKLQLSFTVSLKKTKRMWRVSMRFMTSC